MFDYKYRLAQKILSILVFPYIFLVRFVGLVALIAVLQNPAILFTAFMILSLTFYYILSVRFLVNMNSTSFSKLFFDLLSINIVLTLIFNIFFLFKSAFFIIKIIQGNTDFLTTIFEINPDFKNKVNLNLDTFIQYFKGFLYIMVSLIGLFIAHIIITFINFYKYKKYLADGN